MLVRGPARWWFSKRTPIPTTSALAGGLPTAVSCASRSGRAETQGGPFTLSVVVRPGMTNRSPARPVATTFCRVSRRLLPVASGN